MSTRISADPANSKDLPPEHLTEPKTLHYVNRLRVLLVVLVVAHHAGQSYGPTGGDWPVFNPERSALLAPFFTVNAAFFMGFFFFLSGLFVPASLARKGYAKFIRERAIRLGIPLIVFSFGVFAAIEYGANGDGRSFIEYYMTVYIGEWQITYGPLWFVFHLLVYSIVYATLAQLVPELPRSGAKTAIGHMQVLGFAISLAALTSLIRLFYTHDAWIDLFGVIPAEPAHLPQYIMLFLLGTLTGRFGWLETLTRGVSRLWLLVGIILAAYWYGMAWSGGALTIPIPFHVWEAFLCVGLCVGLTGLARDTWNRPSHIWRWLSDRSYAVFLVHVFNVVGLQFALLDAELAPLAKFAIVTIAAIATSFLSAAILKAVPFVKRVV